MMNRSFAKLWTITACVVVLTVLSTGCGSSGSSVTPTPQPAPSPTPTPAPTPTPTPTPTPALGFASLSLNPTSVAGGTSSQATVTLAAVAPTGNAVVTLSSNNAAATVPSTVTVSAGATTATFAITTASVNASTPVTITAAFGGVTQTATLTVTSTLPVASFRVTSTTRGDNACALSNNGNNIDCTFDGSASTGTGGVRSWRWTVLVGTQSRITDSSQPVTRPEAGCVFLGGATPSQDGAIQFIQMEVRLKVTDSRGVEGQETVNRNVRLFPNTNCYGF